MTGGGTKSRLSSVFTNPFRWCVALGGQPISTHVAWEKLGRSPGGLKLGSVVFGLSSQGLPACMTHPGFVHDALVRFSSVPGGGRYATFACSPCGGRAYLSRKWVGLSTQAGTLPPSIKAAGAFSVPKFAASAQFPAGSLELFPLSASPMKRIMLTILQTANLLP